ncbi:unnamed protein product [Cuscuta campestris]|uniref:Uncharacterized protein n=1 Tax=Cuscuta campestris TaxID=132261 RepID=A0A484MKD8_9ASTE|nr:unnamed protein product [Cuscuta campestris]
MSPPRNLRLSDCGKSATTRGRSSTVHFKLGNTSKMSLAIIPVPPPTSTKVFSPSKTWPQSFNTKHAILVLLDIASLKAVLSPGFVSQRFQKGTPLAISNGPNSSFLESQSVNTCHGPNVTCSVMMRTKGERFGT